MVLSKALEIASERYAKGEISKEEFEEIKSSLASSTEVSEAPKSPVQKQVNLSNIPAPQSNKWGWKKTLQVGALIGVVFTIGNMFLDGRSLDQQFPNAMNETEIYFGLFGSIVGGAVGFMLVASIVAFVRNLFVK